MKLNKNNYNLKNFNENQGKQYNSLLFKVKTSNSDHKHSDPKGLLYIYWGLCLGFISAGMIIFGVFNWEPHYSDIYPYFIMLIFIIVLIISILSIIAGFKLIKGFKKRR